MKYIVVLGDGMADYRKGPLGNRTPLDIALKPNIDRLAKEGTVGLIKTVDNGMKPGSDVANLSVLGYDPTTCYTGRSPLEALSLRIPMSETDTVFRVNWVTLSATPLPIAPWRTTRRGKYRRKKAKSLWKRSIRRWDRTKCSSSLA